MNAVDHADSTFDWREASHVPASGQIEHVRFAAFATQCALPEFFDFGTAAPHVIEWASRESHLSPLDAECKIRLFERRWECAPALTSAMHLVLPVVAGQTVAPLSGRQMADDLRTRTGLSDGELSELMAVTRETYNRWRNGSLSIGRENLARLQSLHLLLCEADSRTDRLRDWLVTPQIIDEAESAPLSLLKSRQYTRVWDLVTRLQTAKRTAKAPPVLAFDHDRDDYEPDLSDWDDG